MQFFEEQLPLSLQAAPFVHAGEQAGTWQSPFVQTFPPQSALAPQGAPCVQ
jgi:hypothetical protein